MNIPKKTKLLNILLLSAFLLPSISCPCNADQKKIAAAAPTTTVHSETITYKFVSCLDGEEDSYSLRLSRSPKNSGILLVYLHSLTGDFSELYKSGLAEAINKAFPTLSLLSCNYGHTPSWGNAIARIDITNNIQEAIKKTNGKYIVLIGTSMGASTALAYAATAPSYIKNRIIGIVTVAPCAELGDLDQKSLNPDVKSSLEAALGGSASEKPAFYHQNSLDACLAFLPQRIKIAIITTQEDNVIPIALQTDVVRDLNNRNANLKSFELEGKSEPPPVESIMEGLHFILQ